MSEEFGEQKTAREKRSISELTFLYLQWKGSEFMSYELKNELSSAEKMDMIKILNSYILIMETERK